MSDFQGIVTGNIASTPISKGVNMSPSEIAAFERKTQSEPLPTEPVHAPQDNSELWATMETTSWNEPMFGTAISNNFRRVTRKMEVPGGTLYSVATYGICYVRGTANANTSETLVFVPNTENTKTKK